MARGPARFGDGRDWFFDHQFGMFVHWGLYAIHGWHEQEQWRGRVPADEYIKLQAQWNPVNFSADAWLDRMQATGMTYLVVTTKHHDGFCLWDTKQTAFNTMNTPYGRDIVAQLAEACHRRNVPLCFYYSIADWHQPNYPNLGRHHELPAPKPGDEPDWDKYMAFLREQVRELCTNYGELHGFWWDMNVPEHVDPSINAMIRELQPKAVINNRGFDDGDFGTPERDYEKDDGSGLARLTEACQSVGMESWGYRIDEDYYSDRHLLRSIAKFMARGANYLLNVGPMADGRIPGEASSILDRLGVWYAAVRDAFDADPAPGLVANKQVMVTRRDTTLYVFLLDPIGDGVKLKPLQTMPHTATLLNDGRRIECDVTLLPTEHVDHLPCLRLKRLPINELAGTLPVVKLEFDSAPEAVKVVERGDDLRVR